MPKTVADYPATIWDGLSDNTGRINLVDDIEPNPQDWAKIVEEVRAVEKQQKEDREFDAVNDEGGPVVPGNVVYMKADGTIALADADDSGTRVAVGLVKAGVADGISTEVIYNGRLELTLAEWDAVGLSSAGLVIGASYYMADVAGEITATPPATATDTLFKLGVAISATVLLVRLDDEGLAV